MGVVISTTIISPFSLITGIFGLVGFTFTIGTFVQVVWTNLSTLSEAQHEVHSYITNLRQELLEERQSLKYLKKASNKNKHKSRDSRHGGDVEDHLDLQLNAATIKTMSDSIRHMIKRFQALEKPFLEPGEEGIQKVNNSNNRRSRRRRNSGSPYYKHEAYRSTSHEKPVRDGSNEGNNNHRDDDDNDYDDVFWPQRVRYADFTLRKRFQWLRSKGDAQQLFELLGLMQTRRTARQVGSITLMMNDFAGMMKRLDESLDGIEDRLNRMTGGR